MSWMACRSCTTRFAVGLLQCPHCQALSELYAVPDYVVDAEEENMPKISVEGGPSNALGQPAEPETPAPEPAELPVQAEPETSDTPSAGTAEDASASEPAADVEANTAPVAKPARKTAAKKAAAKQESAAKG